MKILMIVAKRDFRDEEFNEPFKIFKDNQLVVDIASTEKGECIGKFGTRIEADRSFDDVVIEEYFAVVVIGGPGSYSLLGNSALENILRKAKDRNIVLAAICYAPAILAKAGVLNGKKATVWNGDGKQSPMLEENGAEFIDQNVVVDGKFITGNGPGAAEEFGKNIVRAIEKTY